MNFGGRITLLVIHEISVGQAVKDWRGLNSIVPLIDLSMVDGPMDYRWLDMDIAKEYFRS